MARKLWARAPWAKDPAKVDTVQMRIALLVDQVAQTSRNASPETADAQVSQLFDRFEKQLQTDGIPSDQALQIKESVRGQIRSTIQLPLEDVRLVKARLEIVEAENLEMKRRLDDLEKSQGGIGTEWRQLRNHVLFALMLGTAALALALAIVLLRR
ncbi:hypothetical protein EON79_10140 [bacterium]|nr:MAG: hypothetical protein EON79_10140 [bacterium]